MCLGYASRPLDVPLSESPVKILVFGGADLFVAQNTWHSISDHGKDRQRDRTNMVTSTTHVRDMQALVG